MPETGQERDDLRSMIDPWGFKFFLDQRTIHRFRILRRQGPVQNSDEIFSVEFGQLFQYVKHAALLRFSSCQVLRLELGNALSFCLFGHG
jgi:hypothetical protein